MATDTVSRAEDRSRRVSSALFRHPRLKLGVTLLPPLGWMVVIYLSAIGFMLLTSFWRLDSLTSDVVQDLNLQNYIGPVGAYTSEVYRTIALRTLGMAVMVTVTDLVLAFPLAYYMARLATPRGRNWLVLAVIMPLWANYLVRVFAWKTALTNGGPVEALFGLAGLDIRFLGTSIAVWITLSYLWFPFVVLPIYAAMERVPDSLLEASGDLGARGWMTFRRVLLPLVFPGVVAASIFAFSLSLGDYITTELMGKKLFIGNAISQLTGIANNRPLAAALATIPMLIMAIYLLGARRLGAFEAL
jgi:putative spermidine/putrescine transport system permease protein